MELKVKEKVLAELEKIVGAEFVSNALPDLFSYSQDMTENEPSWPDFVVMPDSVEEVQEIMRLANREKIPVVPIVGGGNIGGLTIPLKGGISLDMKRMDRMIEFNAEDMYIVVEPGFTFGHLKRFLDKNAPQLTYSWPVAPPSSSLTCNALLQGLGNLSTRVGAHSDIINGLEVVLPTGEVAKIGSCAVSPSWFGRAPLPDIAGLFIGWQGATGVVTKTALQLWHKPEYAESISYLTYDVDATFRFMRRIARTQVVEDSIVMTYETTKVLLFRNTGPFERPPGEPEFMNSMTIRGNTEDELKAKTAFRDQLMKEEFKDTKVDVNPGAPQEGPIRGIIDALGGCTWVGTYAPTSEWEKTVPMTYPIFDKYRLPRVVFLRPFKEGHFGMWRPIIAFNRNDADEVERVRKLMREMLALALDCGYVPYKSPYWAIQMMLERADPNFIELVKRVKNMLDPNDIMNPGRWGDLSSK
ncbi:4-cresol dehydrogenase [hydroxylating] flavoprotein subunit [subsurface metagenome]